MTRCRILLDVDGVLNAVTRAPGDHWDDWRVEKCMGFPITHSPAVGARLLALAERPEVELIWLTTWEHNANDWIGPLFGWPSFRVLDRHDLIESPTGLIVSTQGWWKLDEAQALWEDDPVPFVWIDDDLGIGDDGATDWIHSLDGAAIGVRPDSERGLTPNLLDVIEEFVLSKITDGPGEP